MMRGTVIQFILLSLIVCRLNVDDESSGSWILFLAIATCSLLLLAISLFFIVRRVWKRKQAASKIRKERERKLGVVSGGQLLDFQIPDAIPLLVQTVTTKEEDNESQPDLVQQFSLYNISNKALSLFNLHRIPDRGDSALCQSHQVRGMSTGNLDVEELDDERAVQSPYSISQLDTPTESNGTPVHPKRPIRLSLVDMTVPKGQGQVAKQRCYSQEDLTKIQPNHNTPTREYKSSQKNGRIVFGVLYNEDEHKLVVHVVNAMDLPLNNNNLLDSFVRLSLKCTVKRKAQAKYQSKIIKKSCNPFYNERLEFASVHLEELPITSLKIKVFNRVSFSRNELVGEALVSLSDPEVLGQEGIIRDLVPKRIRRRQKVGGEMMISVCHHATSAQLKVSVIKMKNLPKPSKAACVTVKLHYKDQVLHTEEAKPKKNRNGTVYNDLFMFDVHTSTSCTLENFSLSFTAYHYDFLRNKEIVGCVQLSDDAPAGSERRHWKKVTSSPLKAYAEWHQLHETP